MSRHRPRRRAGRGTRPRCGSRGCAAAAHGRSRGQGSRASADGPRCRSHCQGRAAPGPGIRLHLERPVRAVGGGDREHVHPTADVQSEPFLEGAVVVGDHLGRRAGRIRRAQRHTGKVGNAVSGTESERRPAVSPSAARARVRVEDDEVAARNEAAAHEVVGNREAGLSGPDDRGVDVSHDDWNGRHAEGIPATTRPGMPCRARCTAWA